MDNATQPSMHPTPSVASSNGDADLTGRTLGDFHILRRLGQGGMGQVYLAEQVSLKRKVALKILKAELAANPASLQRFKAEAENVARATHANIVQVYAIGESDGLHYMALEYVEGRNLRDHLARKGPPDVLLALSIMRQVAAALQRASELGITHRDIKPENILLTRKGEAKVADFGLSRCLAPDQQPLHLTQSGVAMGTPLYMSPEQVEGRPVDPRTDIYSLGVTCYHMLAGQPPFHGATAFSVAMQHVQGEAVPLETVRPDLPAELCAIVRKMMAKDPDQRYQTANELFKDLLHLRESLTGVAAGLQTQPVPLESAPVPQPALATPTLPSVTRPRRWLPWAAAASVIVALAAGAAFAWVRHTLHVVPPSAVSPTSPDRDTIEAMFSPQKREAKLLADVEKHVYFGPDRTRMQPALGAYLDLGLFYLEQWRLDDAERFFAKLNNPQYPAPYGFLGRLGQAMVLAFQDRAKESNELFMKLLGKRPPEGGDRAEFVMLQQRNPQLRPMVAKTLDYNAVNATPDNPFPPQLEHLRKPPPPRRPATDKPPIKGE